MITDKERMELELVFSKIKLNKSTIIKRYLKKLTRKQQLSLKYLLENIKIQLNKQI